MKTLKSILNNPNRSLTDDEMKNVKGGTCTCHKIYYKNSRDTVGVADGYIVIENHLGHDCRTVHNNMNNHFGNANLGFVCY